MDLVETIEMIDLSELKEFDCTPKRKRNKGKEKETESKIADFSLGMLCTCFLTCNSWG